MNKLEISRVEGPQTKNLRDWTVKLSAAPRQQWQAVFMQGSPNEAEMSVRALRSKVQFHESSLSFPSDANEDNVRHWVDMIDKWIAAANQRYADHLVAVEQERAAVAQKSAEHESRIREANEKFRKL